MSVTIKTNNVPRDILDAFELTNAERGEFDYLNWNAIENGEDSASFFRYKDTVYDLGEFQVVTLSNQSVQGWDGFISDSFFSGILVKYVNDCEQVIVATFYS